MRNVERIFSQLPSLDREMRGWLAGELLAAHYWIHYPWHVLANHLPSSKLRAPPIDYIHNNKQGVCTERSCVHTQMTDVDAATPGTVVVFSSRCCTSISEVSLNGFAGQFFPFYLWTEKNVKPTAILDWTIRTSTKMIYFPWCWRFFYCMVFV